MSMMIVLWAVVVNLLQQYYIFCWWSIVSDYSTDDDDDDDDYDNFNVILFQWIGAPDSRLSDTAVQVVSFACICICILVCWTEDERDLFHVELRNSARQYGIPARGRTVVPDS